MIFSAPIVTAGGRGPCYLRIHDDSRRRDVRRFNPSDGFYALCFATAMARRARSGRRPGRAYRAESH